MQLYLYLHLLPAWSVKVKPFIKGVKSLNTLQFYSLLYSLINISQDYDSLGSKSVAINTINNTLLIIFTPISMRKTQRGVRL